LQVLPDADGTVLSGGLNRAYPVITHTHYI
jgi:hypothetical protein